MASNTTTSGTNAALPCQKAVLWPLIQELGRPRPERKRRVRTANGGSAGRDPAKGKTFEVGPVPEASQVSGAQVSVSYWAAQC
jgi:hypothetical protein